MSLWMILDASVTVSDTEDCPFRTGIRVRAADIRSQELVALRRYISVTVSDTEDCP
jgi:hypothetical protein